MSYRAIVLVPAAIALSSCGAAIDADFEKFCAEFEQKMRSVHSECEDPDSTSRERKNTLIDAWLADKEYQEELDEVFERGAN